MRSDTKEFSTLYQNIMIESNKQLVHEGQPSFKIDELFMKLGEGRIPFFIISEVKSKTNFSTLLQ